MLNFTKVTTLHSDVSCFNPPICAPTISQIHSPSTQQQPVLIKPVEEVDKLAETCSGDTTVAAKTKRDANHVAGLGGR